MKETNVLLKLGLHEMDLYYDWNIQKARGSYVAVFCVAKMQAYTIFE